MKLTCYAWIAVGMVSAGFVHFATAQESTQKVARTLPALWPLPTAPIKFDAPPPPPIADASATTPLTRPPTPPTPQIQLSNNIITWDADSREYTAKPGEMTAPFMFSFTNVSPQDVTINSVGTSCGCTVAQLPPLPWKLTPGTNGVIPVTMNLAGKSGVVFKTVTVNTDKGTKSLIVKVTIEPPPAPPVTVNAQPTAAN